MGGMEDTEEVTDTEDTEEATDMEDMEEAMDMEDTEATSIEDKVAMKDTIMVYIIASYEFFINKID